MQLTKANLMNLNKNLIPCEFTFNDINIVIFTGSRGSGKTQFMERCKDYSSSINSVSEIYFQKRPERPKNGVYPFSNIPQLRGISKVVLIFVDEIFDMTPQQEDELFSICKQCNILLVGTTTMYPQRSSELYKILIRDFPETLF